MRPFYSTFCETKGADTLYPNVPLAYYGAFQAPSLPNGPLQGALGTQSVLPTLALAGLRPAALLQSEAKLLSRSMKGEALIHRIGLYGPVGPEPVLGDK